MQTNDTLEACVSVDVLFPHTPYPIPNYHERHHIYARSDHLLFLLLFGHTRNGDVRRPSSPPPRPSIPLAGLGAEAPQKRRGREQVAGARKLGRAQQREAVLR